METQSGHKPEETPRLFCLTHPLTHLHTWTYPPGQRHVLHLSCRSTCIQRHLDTLQDHTQLHLSSCSMLLHMCAASSRAVSLTPLSACVSYRCGCAGGSQACWQRSRLPPAQSACGWWHSALTAGWSPLGWLIEWPHLCAEPTACCHPSFSGFLPEEERRIR